MIQSYSSSRSDFDGWIKLAVVWCAITLIAGGLSFTLSQILFDTDRTVWDILKCLFLIISISIAVGLFALNTNYSIWFLAFIFIIFSFYHTINFGNTCNCFANQQKSNLFSLASNLGMALLLIGCSIHFVKRKLIKTLFVISIVALGLVTVLGPTEDRPEAWFDICSLHGSNNPFLRKRNSTESFYQGSWQMMIAKRNCDHCMKIAEKLDATIALKISTSEEPNFLIYRNLSQTTWEISILEAFLPEGYSDFSSGELTLVDGVVTACEKISSALAPIE